MSHFTGYSIYSSLKKPLGTWKLLNNKPLSESSDCWWQYIWGNRQFSSIKSYPHLTGHAQVPLVFKWLWKSSCQNKHKVFFWLLLQDRLRPRNLLRRTMILDSYDCELFSSRVKEYLKHLFLNCPFASAFWSLNNLHVPPQASVFETIDSFRIQLHTPVQGWLDHWF